MDDVKLDLRNMGVKKVEKKSFGQKIMDIWREESEG